MKKERRLIWVAKSKGGKIEEAVVTISTVGAKTSIAFNSRQIDDLIRTLREMKAYAHGDGIYSWRDNVGTRSLKKN